MTRGGARPGAGRPATTNRATGPQTVIRWSAEEHAEVVAKAGDAKAVAAQGRRLLLAWARRPVRTRTP